jgi:hypothetical protein
VLAQPRRDPCGPPRPVECQVVRPVGHGHPAADVEFQTRCPRCLFDVGDHSEQRGDHVGVRVGVQAGRGVRVQPAQPQVGRGAATAQQLQSGAQSLVVHAERGGHATHGQRRTARHPLE